MQVAEKAALPTPAWLPSLLCQMEKEPVAKGCQKAFVAITRRGDLSAPLWAQAAEEEGAGKEVLRTKRCHRARMKPVCTFKSKSKVSLKE